MSPTYAYDARNRRTTTTEPAVADWDNSGTSTSPVLTTYYDAAGNPYKTTDALGGNTVTEFDAANRPVWVFSPSAAYWNGTGNVSSQFLATKKTYDADGNVLQIQQGYATTQASANATITLNSTTNTYDALNRLLTTEDAANITETNQYDAAGNRSKVIDGNTHETTFTFDGLKRVLTIEDALGNSTVYTYGPADVASLTYANGNGFTYTYDARNRMVKDGTYYYTYDYAGELIYAAETGIINDYSDQLSNFSSYYAPFYTGASYAYDGAGRVIFENQGGADRSWSSTPGDDISGSSYGSLPGSVTGGNVLAFTYDKAGNRLTATYTYGVSGNRTLTSTYDALNRLLAVNDTVGNTTYHYDLAGHRVGLLYPSGSDITTTFDALGRQAEIIGHGNSTTTRYDLVLAYDLYSNLGHQAETYTNGNLTTRTLALAYDNANRLTSELISTGSGTITNITNTFTYDAGYNRSTKVTVQKIGSGGNTTEANITYHYDAANQLNYYVNTIGSVTTNLTYDHAGNRLSSVNGTANLTYTYDVQNRLSEIDSYNSGYTSYEPVSDYAYDYRGRRAVRGQYGFVEGSSTTENITTSLFDGWQPCPGAAVQLRRLQQHDADHDPLGIHPGQLTGVGAWAGFCIPSTFLATPPLRATTTTTAGAMSSPRPTVPEI